LSLDFEVNQTVIEFLCPCTHRFVLEDSQAGGTVQCPKCRRLNDVPTVDDLRRLADDGTYLLDSAPVAEGPDVAETLAYVYQRGARDARGNEIDLRLRRADIEAIGGEPVPLFPEEAPNEHAPKYDPDTGELILPHEINHDGPSVTRPQDIPMARAAINYASAGAFPKFSFVRAFGMLFSPLNVMAVFAVFCMHVLFWPLLLVTFAGIAFFIVAVPVLGALILSHYGNVIEDAGPFEKDEFPRPMRDLGWYEDIWFPFCNVFASLMICYFPGFLLAILLVQVPRLQLAAVGVMVVGGAIGTFFLPAVLLSLHTSGSLLNVRPDRVLAVIGICGRSYFIAVVIWVFTAGIYAFGFGGTCLAIAAFLHPSDLPGWLTSWATTVPALVIGIFLMHYFCFCLGLLYRAHYQAFPWVLQRHIPTRKPDATTPHPIPRRSPPLARNVPARRR
jgi:hypothetical protein